MTNHGAERRFAISLAENGFHSLDRAISAFEQFDSTGAEILLKDTIMFLHHGVELLMKQILVNHSEYLVFKDLQEASRKQMQADELGLAVLFLENPPHTVTFLEAIDRVRACVRPPELTDYLVADLRELNRLRNQLEHYAIDVDAKEIAKLIASIHSQLMALFEAQLPGIGLATVFTRASVVAEPHVSYCTGFEQEVCEQMRRFAGQEVPGRLFSQDGVVVLPTFHEVLLQPAIRTGEGGVLMPDIFAEGDSIRWVVEVKHRVRENLPAMMQVIGYGAATKATPWLVVSSSLTSTTREQALAKRVLVTGIDEWKELKLLVTHKESAA